MATNKMNLVLIGLLILVVIGIILWTSGFFTKGFNAMSGLKPTNDMAEFAAKRNERFAVLSRDYICPISDGVTKENFFTLDTETGLLESITIFNNGYTPVTTSVGHVNGTVFESYWSDLKGDGLWAEKCIDKNGKTIFDKYSIVNKASEKYYDERFELEQKFLEKYR